ncbi:protein zwilch homolog [Synchiropus picturatus]
MGSKVVSSAKDFSKFLRSLQEGGDDNIYEDDIQIVRTNGEKLAVPSIYCGNQSVVICEKAVKKVDKLSDSGDQDSLQVSDCTDSHVAVDISTLELGPEPLSVKKARNLLSLYTLSHNAQVITDNSSALDPLWVRCDMSDPASTTWLGAETVCTGSKVCGMKFYSVTSKGPAEDRKSFLTLDGLKQEHKKRHHSTTMVTRGSARFLLYGSTIVENTAIKSQSTVTVDLQWSHVERILETPPLSSTATLNIKVASGCMRSPMFSMFRELEFLQVLADGLRTGEPEWMEPLEITSPVTLVKVFLEELQNTVKTLQVPAEKKVEGQASNNETDTPIFNSLLERGNLDFIEKLWVQMWKSVTSYQHIGDCLKLVIDTLRYGDIKPWIHRDSSSSLSKLILQSYHQQIAHVSLTGVTPVHMLLEMGLDKMRRDYINYLIGEELTTLNHLGYFLNTEVDLQEQVTRLRKLHHLLEIILTCSTFLGLPYDRLFALTQSCLQHYRTNPYDEQHEFKLQIKPTLISQFYQEENPIMWGVEVSSGQGPHELKTVFQLSDRPLVDHVIFDTQNPNEIINGDGEDPALFSTLICSSLVNFTR